MAAVVDGQCCSEIGSSSGSHAPQPAVDRARRLLYRRVKVLLPSGRVITGDLACLDKQGNLILNNAAEHQGTAAAAAGSGDSGSANASSGTGTSTGSSGEPRVTQLGMVLVPKAQQAQVLLEVSLSERTAMLDLVEVGDDGAT